MTEPIEWTWHDAAGTVRAATDSDDKYSRGVVGLRTGSQRYPGAAVLGTEGAWRTGVGMVRYIGPPEPRSLVLARRPETVTAPGRVQAWVVGSGTEASERSPDEQAALRDVLDGEVPVILDAGALDLAGIGAARRILTPHAGELDRLRHRARLPRREDRHDAAREIADTFGAVVLLKGARTLVVEPGGWSAAVVSPTAWLASAGTGDVLAGIIGGLVATAEAPGAQSLPDLAAVAATGAWVHGAAAAHASAGHEGGPVTALDVAAAVPWVIGSLVTH